MRIPSIHIRQDHFRKIMGEILPLPTSEVEALCEELFIRAKPLACSQRSVYLDEKSKKRTERTLLVDNNTGTLKFQSIYIKVRRALKHQNVRAIKPGEKDWPTLKEIATNAQSFCREFQLNEDEGYTIYLKIAFQLNPKPYLNLLVNLHEKITAYFNAESLIEEDPNADASYKAYTIYNSLIVERVGLDPDYYQDPLNYLFFIQVPSVVANMGGTVKQYILAQFEELAWTGSYPEPNQLVGDKAIKRYIKHCYKNQIKLRR